MFTDAQQSLNLRKCRIRLIAICIRLLRLFDESPIVFRTANNRTPSRPRHWLLLDFADSIFPTLQLVGAQWVAFALTGMSTRPPVRI